MSEVTEWSSNSAQIQFGSQSLFNDLKNDRVLNVISFTSYRISLHISDKWPSSCHCRSPVNTTGCTIRFKRQWIKEDSSGLDSMQPQQASWLRWHGLFWSLLEGARTGEARGHLGRRALPSAWWSRLRPSGEPQFTSALRYFRCQPSSPQKSFRFLFTPSSFRGAASGRPPPPSMRAVPQWAGGVCWGVFGKKPDGPLLAILW